MSHARKTQPSVMRNNDKTIAVYETTYGQNINKKKQNKKKKQKKKKKKKKKNKRKNSCSPLILMQFQITNTSICSVRIGVLYLVCKTSR